MSFTKKKKSLTIAVIAGILMFCILGFLSLNNPQEAKQTNAPVMNHYVVAKVEIDEGKIITDEEIEMRDFPMKILDTYNSTSELVGKRAKRKILPDRPITSASIRQAKTSAGINDPRKGYRVVPVYIKKTLVPPYVVQNGIYDLYSKDSEIKISNLRILDIIEPATENETSLLFLFEIKEKDVSSFVDNVVNGSGFVFVKKNEDEYGNYAFINKKQTALDAKAAPQGSVSGGSLSSVDKIPDIGELNGGSKPSIGADAGDAVELIVGSTKSKVEF